MFVIASIVDNKKEIDNAIKQFITGIFDVYINLELLSELLE